MPARKKARTTRRRSTPSGVHVVRTRTPKRIYQSLFSQGITDPAQYAASDYGLSYDTANPAQKLKRVMDGYKGMGAYYGGGGAYNRLNKAKRWTGFASGLMKSGRSMLSGSGDYVYNSTFPQNSGMGPPVFDTVPDELGSIVISYKEYLTDIFGNDEATVTSNNFTTVQYNINPGLERSFPFLSQFAQNFDEYDLQQCVFTYKSTINTDSSTTNGQVGSVIMATNYIVGQPAFNDKNSMLQYAGSSSARVTDVSIHGVECDPDKLSGTRGKYIRSAPVLLTKTQELYDHATFNLAISGTPEAFANVPIGELWVEYTVVLRKPKVLTGLGQAISRDLFAFITEQTSLNWWPLLTASQLSGQQNSIGCSVSMFEFLGVDGDMYPGMKIVFPTWYTSPTEIRLTLMAASDSLIGTIYSPPLFNATSYGYNDLITTGNMVAQKDLVSLLVPSDPTQGLTKSPVFQSWSSPLVARTVVDFMSTFVLIIHVRPGTLYGGVNPDNTSIENSIIIPIFKGALDATTGARPAISYGSLNIQEYSQMNNPGDTPVMINSEGVPIALS